MTERFTVPLKYSLSHSKIQFDGEPLTNNQLVRILNTNDGAYLENFNLKKENEQLKLFKEDVFNKIDMHLRMLPTARDNEFNEDDGDPSLYVGAIYMLETLKKELKE